MDTIAAVIGCQRLRIAAVIIFVNAWVSKRIMTAAYPRTGAWVDTAYRSGDTPPMATPTRASAALRSWLADPAHPERSQVSLAASLHCVQPAVAAWVAERSRPQAHLRTAVEMVAGIPASWWELPEERAQVEAVRAGLVPPTTDGGAS